MSISFRHSSPPRFHSVQLHSCCAKVPACAQQLSPPQPPPATPTLLQVKYPASQPALPVGLTGSTFSAVFGANQSTLEALTLKRRIMGPCWLTVRRPRRVAPESQVSGPGQVDQGRQAGMVVGLGSRCRVCVVLEGAAGPQPPEALSGLGGVRCIAWADGWAYLEAMH